MWSGVLQHLRNSWKAPSVGINSFRHRCALLGQHISTTAASPETPNGITACPTTALPDGEASIMEHPVSAVTSGDVTEKLSFMCGLPKDRVTVGGSSSTMKANVYIGGEDGMSFRTREIPTIINPTDVIVQVAKTTICGTDLHILQGNVNTMNVGTTLGHEAIGTIIHVGHDVKVFQEGDRVLVPCITKCGVCDRCMKGMYGHCRQGGGGWSFGNLMNGMQAEYIRVPFADTSLHYIPLNASDGEENQYLMCADILPTSYEVGLLAGKMSSQKSVAIVGCGPVGLSTILNAVSVYNPSKIIAIDMLENRLQAAKDFGATHTTRPLNHQDGVKQVMDLTDGEGVDLAIECVGTPHAWYTCQDIVSRGGSIAMLGVHGEKATINMERMWQHNFEFSAGLVHCHTIDELMGKISKNELNAEKLISHTCALSEIESAYDTFKSRQNKLNPDKPVMKIVMHNDISPKL